MREILALLHLCVTPPFPLRLQSHPTITARTGQFRAMRVARTIRWFRSGLLGLFIIAQVAGIVPLIYDHTLNLFETTPVAGHAHRHVSAVAALDENHHHGVLDLHDQCCALHTLAGPLPVTQSAAPLAFPSGRTAPLASIVFAQRGPVLPDRPPRPLPLI
jgi:hypothetical protein